jgi:hypothetical protein
MNFGEALPLPQPAARFALEGESSSLEEAGGRSLFLEMCSGSCRVSRSFENKGQEALGVDSMCRKSWAEGMLILVDLTTGMGQDLFGNA